jgi:hypothetical protein
MTTHSSRQPVSALRARIIEDMSVGIFRKRRATTTFATSAGSRPATSGARAAADPGNNRSGLTCLGKNAVGPHWLIRAAQLPSAALSLSARSTPRFSGSGICAMPCRGSIVWAR